MHKTYAINDLEFTIGGEPFTQVGECQPVTFERVERVAADHVTFNGKRLGSGEDVDPYRLKAIIERDKTRPRRVEVWRLTRPDGSTEDRIDAYRIPFTADPKIGRNDPCPCGSGKKHKRCCR